LVNKVLQIYRDEGALSLMKRMLSFLFSKILLYETYYLTKIHIEDSLIKQPKPVDFADKLTFKWIESNYQAEEIAREYEDFRPYTKNAHQRLDAGGIAVCTYVDKELACYAWVAINESGMKAMSHMPVTIDFDNKEVYSSYSYTIPKYRRKGIRYYRLRFRYKMFVEKGVEVLCSAIRTNNYASLKANSDRPKYMITAKVYILKILGLRFFKETPINVKAQKIVDSMSG